MTLGNRIAALRKTAGLSQEALAARLGVSRQAIGKCFFAVCSSELIYSLGVFERKVSRLSAVVFVVCVPTLYQFTDKSVGGFCICFSVTCM